MFKKYIKYISLSLVLILLAGLFTACGSDKIEIGVVTGTTFAEEVETWEKVDEVKLYADDNRTLQELSSGRIDGVVSDKLVGLINIKEGGFDNLKLAGGLIYKETIAVAVRQEDDSLRQAVNNALAEIIEDGTYAKISKKYFNKDILEGVKYEKTFPNEKPANDGSLK
ncbi:MAG: transporter substrate-binding domain-containing protein, partial [Clostridia bacterium]|nr:transporter substrate-binding domain-containing protein [Clostridia bacterium]